MGLRILVLYSRKASDLWVSRVIFNIRKLLGAEIRMIELPSNLNLDDIEEGRIRLSELGRHDIILCMGLPPDALLLVPQTALLTGAAGVLVPVEDPSWAPLGLQRQIEEECFDKGIECVFPRPFCTFSSANSEPLKKMLEVIGTPRFRISVKKGRIAHVEVIRSSPCGASFFVAEKLVGTPVEEAARRASLLHSGFCLASRTIDRVVGDSLLHVSSHLTMKIVEETIARASELKEIRE